MEVLLRIMAGLTEDDLRRIDRFVETKSFHRTPEMLCPSESSDDSETDG